MDQNTNTALPKTITHLAFWDSVACDYYRGIDLAANELKLKRDLVMAFAIIECQNENQYGFFKINGGKIDYYFAISKSLSSLRRRRLELLLSFGLPLLFIGLVGWSLINLSASRTSQVIVTRPGGLKAYQKISAGDLGNSDGPKAAAFVDKYLLTDVPADTVLSEKNLLSPDLSAMMSGRVLFSLPVKGEYIDSSVKPDSKIGLMFAKTEGASEATVVGDIILVGLEKKGETTILVMGLNPVQLAEIKKVLPAPNVFVIRN